METCAIFQNRQPLKRNCSSESMLDPIIIPSTYNYIAAFLTLSCNLSCSYCINHLSGKAEKGNPISGDDWVRGLNRIVTGPGLPITFQGGEPSLHPHFFKILGQIKPETPIDI